ncbi:MAG: 5-(carboxyamino)imidazole ribonucleotide synthase [Patescibacteria group bacterium]
MMQGVETPLPRGAMIGMLGAGQLAKMFAQSASQFGYRTCMMDTKQDCCGFDAASKVVVGSFTSVEDLTRFAEHCSVITLEFENIPLSTLDILQSITGGKIGIYPGDKALRVSQNRSYEKAVAKELGIPTLKYWSLTLPKDFDAITEANFPVIVKTCTNGYDGKGQRRVGNVDELWAAWVEFKKVPCVVEEMIDIDFEMSVIIARNAKGQVASYAPFHNIHKDGILRTTDWPVEFITRRVLGEANEAARKLASHLNVVGLLAVEFFFERNGGLVFNEIAPRPHNSGHVTIECAATSQFEQHVRAVTGLPLGNTAPRCGGRMTNIIGDESSFQDYFAQTSTIVHRYGKVPAPGRKLGHVVEFH